MDLKLKGKYALVTGGTHGIGRAIALGLAEEGCNVAVFSRGSQQVKKTAQEIRAKGVDCIGIPADVMLRADVKKVMQAVLGKWGTVHILINNVGGGGRWGSQIVEETGEKVWQEAYNKNVLSAIRFTKWAIPFMRKQKWGRVVTITSIFAREAGARPWFSMAKAAQASFMKSLSDKHYLAQDNITFNSVAPGAIMIPDTGWEKELKKNPKEVKEFIQRQLPLGRFGSPEEVADIVVFICSERAGLLSGASIPADGGQGRVI